MKVTRASAAPPYAAPAHHNVSMTRLQGHEAGHTERFWVGMSRYHPGGTAEKESAGEETVYVVLDGELVITTDTGDTVLNRLDSVHLAKGEVRSIQNRSDREALLLVTIAHPLLEES
ncbi:beta-D-galactosidase [Mycobacterium angelicum]|uniref:Cupin n=1 Tax=Mycobacterium angelicum TaxID=470074 RepID=A0A1W9ZT26_MYCAN|nr:cupin domain-containing protein [Mycobacterium angelicum]MCV7200354.1 cupin domain-containing protein [Mycobacterium angelicum]ORA20883.1 cupin [Mycobacterium angelicum]